MQRLHFENIWFNFQYCKIDGKLLELIFVKKTSGDRKMKTFLLLRKEEGSRLRKKGQWSFSFQRKKEKSTTLGFDVCSTALFRSYAVLEISSVWSYIAWACLSCDSFSWDSLFWDSCPETVCSEIVCPKTVCRETVCPETVCSKTVCPKTVFPKTVRKVWMTWIWI